MDFKSGCALEAGLEPPTQERGCYETRCFKKLGKQKLFRPKQKQKKFSKEVQSRKLQLSLQQKLFNNLKKSQINSQPWTYHIQINSLITTRPPSPKT
jgi:hypothetical protein